MLGQFGNIRCYLVISDNGGHACLAVASRHGNPVHRGGGDAGEAVDGLFDFLCGHVFPLPAERVTQTVRKLRVAEAHIPEHVSGIEPHVPLFEDIAENFLLRLFFVGITGERGLF